MFAMAKNISKNIKTESNEDFLQVVYGVSE